MHLMVWNQRLKLFASFVRAIGWGLIVLAVLRPQLEAGPDNYWVLGFWVLAGLACHAIAYCVLGYMR